MPYKIPKRKSKEFQKQFRIERREHPAFTDSQVKDIVTDHFIEKKKGKSPDMEIVDDLYDMGEDVAQKSNPFVIAGNGLGYSDEAQKNIYKGKHKVSSPYLKAVGQKDIPIKRRIK